MPLAELGVTLFADVYFYLLILVIIKCPFDCLVFRDCIVC